MKKWFIRIAAVVASVAVLQVALGKMLDTPRGRDVVRLFNRRVLNPLMLRKAGQGNWYASVIETTGRRSGATYRTPIVADPIVGGFIVPLPYGLEVDWLRNAMAAGTATLHRHGVAHTVGGFEPLTCTEAAPLLSDRRRALYRLTGVDRFVRIGLTDPRVTVVG